MSNRNTTTECPVCHKTMRADTLKRHLSTHKRVEVLPEEVEQEVGDFREAAIALWQDHELTTFKNDADCLLHFDMCRNRKFFEEWSASYTGPLPMVPPYKQHGQQLCPFCTVAAWRKILQQAEDNAKADRRKEEIRRQAELKKDAIAKAQAELKAQLEALEEACS